MAVWLDIIGSFAFVTGYKAGLKILDINDPKNPALIGEFNNGGETNAPHVVDSNAYVCDKLQGLEILDVSDPAVPRLVVGVERSIRRISPARTFPGPSSTNWSTPRSRATATAPEKRTGEVSWATRVARIVSGASS